MMRQRMLEQIQIVPVTLGRIQRYIVSTFGIDRARVKEVFVEVVYELEDVAFHRSRDSDIINQADK